MLESMLMAKNKEKEPSSTLMIQLPMMDSGRMMFLMGTVFY